MGVLLRRGQSSSGYPTRLELRLKPVAQMLTAASSFILLAVSNLDYWISFLLCFKHLLKDTLLSNLTIRHPNTRTMPGLLQRSCDRTDNESMEEQSVKVRKQYKQSTSVKTFTNKVGQLGFFFLPRCVFGSNSLLKKEIKNPRCK